MAAFLEADAESGLGSDGIVLEVIVLSVEDEVGTQANTSPKDPSRCPLASLHMFPEAFLNGFGGLTDVEGHIFRMTAGWAEFDNVEGIGVPFHIDEPTLSDELPDKGALFVLCPFLIGEGLAGHEVSSQHWGSGFDPVGQLGGEAGSWGAGVTAYADEQARDVGGHPRDAIGGFDDNDAVWHE